MELCRDMVFYIAKEGGHDQGALCSDKEIFVL